MTPTTATATEAAAQRCARAIRDRIFVAMPEEELTAIIAAQFATIAAKAEAADQFFAAYDEWAKSGGLGGEPFHNRVNVRVEYHAPIALASAPEAQP